METCIEMTSTFFQWSQHVVYPPRWNNLANFPLQVYLENAKSSLCVEGPHHDNIFFSESVGMILERYPSFFGEILAEHISSTTAKYVCMTNSFPQCVCSTRIGDSFTIGDLFYKVFVANSRLQSKEQKNGNKLKYWKSLWHGNVKGMWVAPRNKRP